MEKETDNNCYFRSYVDPEVHKLMLQDKARTDSYQKAILGEPERVKDKVVMDIGAGTGILSLFCMKAGAKKVYAVEASDMVEVLKEIVKKNDPDGIIEVIRGKAEDIDLPEKVDVIVSEWMGFYLLHESMLQSVISARDKHLNPDGGSMLPSHASIYVAACSLEQDSAFWQDVYGFDMSVMIDLVAAREKPEITHLEESDLLSEPRIVAEFDLNWTTVEEIEQVQSRSFVSVTRDGTMRGIAIWFDCVFGDPQSVVLSTAPGRPETHWKQTVVSIPASTVEDGDIVGWDLLLKAEGRKYNITLKMLDADSDEHPVPCGCQWAKCELIKALLEKELNEEIS